MYEEVYTHILRLAGKRVGACATEVGLGKKTGWGFLWCLDDGAGMQVTHFESLVSTKEGSKSPGFLLAYPDVS